MGDITLFPAPRHQRHVDHDILTAVEELDSALKELEGLLRGAVTATTDIDRVRLLVLRRASILDLAAVAAASREGVLAKATIVRLFCDDEYIWHRDDRDERKFRRMCSSFAFDVKRLIGTPCGRSA